MEVSTLDKEVLSIKLKKLVGGKSMTQIAKEMNIGDASFRSYVNGKSLPSASAIAAMAKYFNIPITELTGEGETKSTAIDDVKKALIELSAEERKQILAWLIELV
jgi:transcriptional regulator with XRE-family HTH domain